MTRKTQPGGFTLIEVMVAVSLLAVISFLVWQASGVVIASKERFETQDEYFQGATLAMQQMARDLEGAYLYGTLDFLGRSGSGEQRTKTVFIGRDQGEQDQVIFATLSSVRYLKDSKESDQAEVGYFLEPDPEDSEYYILKRRGSSPPDAQPEEGGSAFVLLSGVSRLNFRYYDAGRGEFLDQWDSSGVDQSNRLPRAVEILLAVKDPGSDEGELRFLSTSFLGMAPGPNDF